MKKRLKKLLLFFGIILASSLVFGQSEGTVSIHSYQFDETNNQVLVSIKTSESFIVGANRYVLHIGGKTFLMSEHPEGRLDEIVFYLPITDYQILVDQSEMVLVYGYYHENVLQDGEGNGANGFTGKHWKLGKFVSDSTLEK